MRPRTSSRRRKQPAQSLVEFALALPIFLILLFGVVDFSRLLFSYISLVNGTRELVRVAALPAAVAAAPTGSAEAFNNFTIIGGTVTPASQVTFTPASGSGSGSISCSSLAAAGCTINVATTVNTSSITVQLTAGSGASGTAQYTFAGASSVPNPTAFNAVADGDFLTAAALGPTYTGTLRVCKLPLATTCAPGALGTASGGFVQVDLTYTFTFNPLFQNKLAGVVDVSLMRPLSTLRTAARSYVE